MIYTNMKKALFVDRPNRFIANILLDGKPIACHVKNTGRCKELLVPGADIIVHMSNNPLRRTPCDLISVYKGDRLINMDSSAPNTVFGEYLRSGAMGFVPELVKAECTRGDSRFDFYFEHGGKAAYAEVKGVTLEENGVVRFPDAPTERGVKHLRGLIDCVKDGFEAYAVFIVQMDNVLYFEPNRSTHPLFADTLKEAAEKGVTILVLDCKVGEDSLVANSPVPMQL